MVVFDHHHLEEQRSIFVTIVKRDGMSLVQSIDQMVKIRYQ